MDLLNWWFSSISQYILGGISMYIIISWYHDISWDIVIYPFTICYLTHVDWKIFPFGGWVRMDHKKLSVVGALTFWGWDACDVWRLRTWQSCQQRLNKQKSRLPCIETVPKSQTLLALSADTCFAYVLHCLSPRWDAQYVHGTSSWWSAVVVSWPILQCRFPQAHQWARN